MIKLMKENTSANSFFEMQLGGDESKNWALTGNHWITGKLYRRE